MERDRADAPSGPAGPRSRGRYTRDRGRPIRTLLQLLLACLFAVVLAVGGYAIMLAVRSKPVGPGDPVTMAVIPTLPEPARLPRRPSFVPASLGSDAPTFPEPTRALSIEVRDLPSPWRSSAGVGVYDEFGMCRDWVPLAATGDVASPLRVRATVPEATRLWVAVAADEEHARHGYWARTEVAADLPTSAVVTLHAPVQQVVVHAGGMTKDLSRALRLRRVDDEDWAPIDAIKGPARADDEGDMQMLLGPGSYQLTPWSGGPWQPLQIEVPGPLEVTATFSQ